MDGYENGPNSDSENTKMVKIEWESDEDHHFPVAGHLLVNFDSDHFYVRFFQVTPPAVPDAENMPESVKGKLVAGVAIPRRQMQGVIGALKENYEAYQKTVGMGSGEIATDSGWAEGGDDE